MCFGLWFLSNPIWLRFLRGWKFIASCQKWQTLPQSSLCRKIHSAEVSDWRLPQLKTYWTLVVRLSWWLGGVGVCMCCWSTWQSGKDFKTKGPRHCCLQSQHLHLLMFVDTVFVSPIQIYNCLLFLNNWSTPTPTKSVSVTDSHITILWLSSSLYKRYLVHICCSDASVKSSIWVLVCPKAMQI